MRLRFVRRFMPVLLINVILCSLLVMSVSAASHEPKDGISVTVSDAKKDTLSAGSLTVEVQGNKGVLGFGASAKTATITICNDGDSTATVSFDWTASSVNELKIDEVIYSSSSGSFSKNMGVGESAIITITTAKNNTTNKLVMSNFNWVAAADNSDVTVLFDSTLGSVTTNGTAISSESVHSVSSDTGQIFVASSTNFVGWIDADTNQRLSTDASYNVIPVKDMRIKAIYGPAARFTVGDYLFETLSDAITYASTASEKRIVLANNGTLPAGNYTIPAGVTLLIPRNAANTVYREEPAVEESSYSNPTFYRTMTMESGANITVNGAISVAGNQCPHKGRNGAPSGAQGRIIMNAGSSITVNSSANLYAWGYIVGETRSSATAAPCEGTITIKNGGTVYESFQVMDFRGGDATTTMASSSNKNTYRVFPMSQYYLQNVQIPMTLEAGASELGFMSVNITLAGIQSAPVPFMGGDGLFQITSGSVTKDYDEATDRMILDINGNVELSSMEINIKVALLGTVNLESSDYLLPLTNNMTINVNSGSNVEIGADVVMLAGSMISIEEGATCTLASGNSIYIFDEDEWGEYCHNNDNVETNAKLRKTPYAYDRLKTRSEADLIDVAVLVNGTLDVSAGAIYTTTGGANIYSTDEGKVITKVGTATFFYQADQKNTEIEEWVKIAVTPAKLKNVPTAYPYTETAKYSGTVTYHYDSTDGVWRPEVAQRYDASGNPVGNPYTSLAKAVEAYTNGSGYIQMIRDSYHENITTGKTVYLDLNGCTVNLGGTATFGTLYGMDTATNDLGISNTHGKITGEISGTIHPIKTWDRGAHSGKTYVAVTDDETNETSFHRLRFGIDSYTYYRKGNAVVAITFSASFMGDDGAKSCMTDFGMEINADDVMYGDSTAGLTERNEAGAPLGYTLLRTVTEPTGSYNVSALLELNDNQIIEGTAYIATVNTAALGGT